MKWTQAQEPGCAQRCSQDMMHTEPTVPQCAPGRANRLKWDTHSPAPSFVKANVTFPYHRPTIQQTSLGRGRKKKRKQSFSALRIHAVITTDLIFLPFYFLFFTSFVALLSDILRCSPGCEGSRNSAFLLLRHRPYTSGFVIKTLASPSLKWCEQGLL